MLDLRRREFLTLLGGGAAAWPLAARAQQPAMPVIGLLHSASAGAFAPFLAALREGLGEAGYVDGQNVRIEFRWAEGQYNRLPAMGAELVDQKVTLISERRVRLYLPLFVLIGLYTGARKEAILSLRWSQVDLVAGRINFNPAGGRRTNKRRPRIPIPPKLLPHLRRARQRGTDIGFVIHENGVRLKDVKKGFASACRRAKLEGVSPHTLRHTCATWLMQAGVDTWNAAGFLGMTVETLQRVYAHHHPDHLRDPAEALSGRPRNVRATRQISGSFRNNAIRKTP
jgi:integrase